MKWTLPAVILLSTLAHGQTTLTGAKAYTSTYINIPQYGVMNNGHPYTLGLTLSQNPTFPYWITRVDLVTKQVTKKTMPGTISYQLGFWIGMFDSTGNFIYPVPTDDYHIRRIGLKEDSITVTDLGLAFKDANGSFVTALVYSQTLGSDGNLYFGAKGNPYWSWYDVHTGTMHYSPNAINDIGIDWVLNIGGDAQSIVAITGQNDSCNAWIINKTTGAKKNIIRTSSSTRPTLECTCDGMYVRNPEIPITKNQWYKIVNGDTVSVPTWSGCRSTYYEANKGGSSPTISSSWDPAKGRLFYSVNGTADSVDIPTNYTQSNIQVIIPDRRDTTHLWYVGSLYGSFYNYNFITDTAVAMGATGYNLYSFKRLNDSIMFLGNYPGAALMEWNLNKPWTAGTFVGASQVSVTDTNANPHIIFQFKNTDGSGSHLATMVLDTVRHLVMTGFNVIRVDETCSFGAYNYETKQGWGYDHNKINLLRLTSITPYRNWLLGATDNSIGGTPKIYFYNPETNTMDDSLSVGLTSYGNIWTIGDQLLGQAGTLFYKINLSTKRLIYSGTGTGSPQVTLLQDGRFAIYNGTAPVDWWQVKNFGYSNLVNVGGFNNFFSVSGQNIIMTRNFTSETIDSKTGAGRVKMLQNFIFNR